MGLGAHVQASGRVTLVLTPDELVEYTGKQRSKAQARALKDMGIPYRLRPDGSPVVLRVHVLYETTEERPASPEMHLP